MNLFCNKFIFNFFKNPFKIGSLTPSSHYLAEAITEKASLPNKKCVVELGPGTGVFTQVILQKVKPETIFFCLELNEHFVKETLKRCPNAIVYHSSAEKVRDYLSLHQQKNCDAVISGIPWTLFNSETQDAILGPVYDALKPDGEFLTFIYITAMILPGRFSFSKKIRKKFKLVTKSEIIWRNFPPVFIYHCKK